MSSADSRAGLLVGGRGLAGVVLAAGEGRRLRPLTEHLPKALVEVGGVSLLDGALARVTAVVGEGVDHVAVNAHHHAEQVVAHVDGRAHVSVEAPDALGTAGALAALAPWLDDRDALVTNADTWTADGAALLRWLGRGWDGERCRLLCGPAGGQRADFLDDAGRGVRYLGSCLLPAALLADLEPVPSGLYEVLWRRLDAAGDLDLVVTDAEVVDCGTPGDLRHARALAGGWLSCVSKTVVVMGVSGSGKTTVALALADRLGWVFAEADDFHPQANIDKMTAGHALTDEDRWPWLRAMRAWVAERAAAGESAVVTCSALKRSYRDLLRGSDETAPAPADNGDVVFLHLVGDRDVLASRMGGRSGHFMPGSLLDSQLATLEPLAPDEAGATVSVELDPTGIVSAAVRELRLG